ncbi:MAG: TlyA family RNA methyltransferase [Actinomycetota bacterium]
MSRRARLDAELVRRGLVVSRVEASRLIDLHRVLVNGAIADKASRQVDRGDAVVVTGEPARFVSRGGEKLDHALTSFAIEVTGARVLDAGASTGGFTDCVLQRGATAVVALDVGHGQLHPKIRGDERVLVIERFNVRELTVEHLPWRPEVVVADLSFISLTKVVGVFAQVASPGAPLVLLVKPQFEAGRQEVAKGRGIITDAAVHERVRGEVTSALESVGCTIVGWCDSPITGSDGNHEFLVHATVGTGELNP